MATNEEIEAYKAWRIALKAVDIARAAIPKEDEEKPEAYDEARRLDKIADKKREEYEALLK